jgi:GNAT superfamily N-acetyltransferase
MCADQAGLSYKLIQVCRLSERQKADLNNLILQCFDKSRLEEYQWAVWQEIDGNVVGFVGLHYEYCYVWNVLMLNQLCVNKLWRNKGVATELLNYLFKLYPDVQMGLYVDRERSTTDGLIRFYSNRGFCVVFSCAADVLMMRFPPLSLSSPSLSL